jgi:hypothetical protein
VKRAQRIETIEVVTLEGDTAHPWRYVPDCDDCKCAEAGREAEIATLLIPFDKRRRMPSQLRKFGLEPHFDEVKRFKIRGSGLNRHITAVLAERSYNVRQDHGKNAIVFVDVHAVLAHVIAKAAKTVFWIAKLHACPQGIGQRSIGRKIKRAHRSISLTGSTPGCHSRSEK